jgi:hypothetical protein
MREGEIAQFIIKPELGYGAFDNPAGFHGMSLSLFSVLLSSLFSLLCECECEYVSRMRVGVITRSPLDFVDAVTIVTGSGVLIPGNSTLEFEVELIYFEPYDVPPSFYAFVLVFVLLSFSALLTCSLSLSLSGSGLLGAVGGKVCRSHRQKEGRGKRLL